MFSPTAPTRSTVCLEKGRGGGRIPSTGSQPPPGWSLGLEVRPPPPDPRLRPEPTAALPLS